MACHLHPSLTPRTMGAHKGAKDVQKLACRVLLSFATNSGAVAKVREAGCVRLVRDAKAASDASEDTKKWGTMLLEKL